MATLAISFACLLVLARSQSVPGWASRRVGLAHGASGGGIAALGPEWVGAVSAAGKKDLLRANFRGWHTLWRRVRPRESRHVQARQIERLRRADHSAQPTGGSRGGDGGV